MVVALVVLFSLGAPVRAQSPVSVFIPVALAPISRDMPLELTALTLDADISESNGRTTITGNSTFKIHSLDKVNDLQVPVGFPVWANDPYAFDPGRLGNFAVAIDGQKVRALNSARAELKIGNVVRAVDWYTFTLAIDTDQKRTVSIDFTQDLGDGAMPRFTYGLVTAQGWKGNVGSSRLTLNFPEMTTLDQIIATDPADPEFNGMSVTWRFVDYEPAINPSLTILRPSVWSDLSAKRRTAQQNPNDANARAALGNVLRSLATLDSPRRDSFYSQAIAELETAVRLDPNQRSARQSLGALYEARAGVATGPRDANYVLLATQQWEKIAANDANARKQLAEDYFYLGLDAQTRRVFTDASAYYDKAQSLAPTGAGPLFTTERMNAQRKSLNVAWGRALLDQNDFATARDKARAALGDKFVSQYVPPAFYVTRTQVTMSRNSRTMAFTLAPVSASPTELQNTFSGVATSMRAVGADTSFDPSNSTFTITVPFSDRIELFNRLAWLAQVTPGDAEWSLIRAVLSPQDIDWQESDQVLMHVTNYREQVDLSAACAAFTAQVDTTSQPLSALNLASAADEEAQFKRAWLNYATGGWQSAFATSRVAYKFGANETRVESCATRSIALSASEFLPVRVALIVVTIEFVGIVVLVIRLMRRTKGERK